MRLGPFDKRELSLSSYSGAKTATKGTKKALALNAKCLIWNDYFMGRGNLNRLLKLLILKQNIGFVFWLECRLECQ